MSPLYDHPPGFLVRRAVVIAGVLMAGVAGAAGSDADAVAENGVDSKRPIVITGGAEEEYRPNCGLRRTGRYLEGFSEALRTVDAPALRRYWRPRGFRAMAVARGVRRLFFATSFRQGLRELRDEGPLRLRVDTVAVGVGAGGRDMTIRGGFRTRGAGRELVFAGKVAVRCDRPVSIHMFGIFMTSQRQAGLIADCPEPSVHVPDRAMVVCGRPDQ